MRFAIFSDVHANLEALEAVLADARKRRCTDFVCLGDVVGYNANPHECVERIRELDCPIVKGNHDEHASLDTELTPWGGPSTTDAVSTSTRLPSIFKGNRSMPRGAGPCMYSPRML